MSATARAGLWIVGGMSLIAFSDNFIAALAEHVGLWQFHLTRSVMVLPVALGFAWLTGRLAGIRAHRPRRVAERCAMHVGALMMYFAALPAVGIAQAAAGLFTSPIWVVVLSALFFGERVGSRRILAVAIGFAGVCLVLGLGAEPVRAMSLVAIGAGIAYALGVIWTRHHCAAESALCFAVWQFVGLGLAGAVGAALVPVMAPALAGVEGATFAIQPWRGLTGWLAFQIFWIGLAGIVATGCLAEGYRAGPSSIVGLFDFSFLFWAPLFAWALWGDALAPRVGLGMALIVVAGALAIWSGARREGPPAPRRAGAT